MYMYMYALIAIIIKPNDKNYDNTVMLIMILQTKVIKTKLHVQYMYT